MRVVARDFYARDTVVVARELLGCILETTFRGVTTSGRIVEVEAYVGPHDPAAHGYGGRMTARNRNLFGPPGMAYVYFIYGMHWCVNAVTEEDGHPSAVLIRALEPLEGVDLMMRRRRTKDVRRLCSGPARLCEALKITGTLNGASLQSSRIRIVSPGEGLLPTRIIESPRVGISRAKDWLLRFSSADAPEWLSRRV